MLFLAVYRSLHAQILKTVHMYLLVTIPFEFLRNSFPNLSFKSSFKKLFKKKDTFQSINVIQRIDLHFAEAIKKEKKVESAWLLPQVIYDRLFPFKIQNTFDFSWKKKCKKKIKRRKQKKRVNPQTANEWRKKRQERKKEKISRKGQNGAFSRFRIFKRIFSAIIGLKINISFFPVFQLRAKKLKYKSSKLLKKEKNTSELEQILDRE